MGLRGVLQSTGCLPISTLTCSVPNTKCSLAHGTFAGSLNVGGASNTYSGTFFGIETLVPWEAPLLGHLPTSYSSQNTMTPQEDARNLDNRDREGNQ